MSTIEESVEVDVPVATAYNQWTQFEDFPRFMEGIDEVRQLDDSRLHWRASIAGVTREWDAQITQQVPDQVIAWQATDGHLNDGAVRFEQIDGDQTRITLQMEHEPEGFVESVGDALGMVKRRAKGDLERFKQLVEAQGTASGEWRGEVRQGRTIDDPSGTADTSELPGAELRDDEAVPTRTPYPHDPEAGLPNRRDDDVDMGQGLSPERGDSYDEAIARDGDIAKRLGDDEGPTPETRDALGEHPYSSDERRAL
jgi:Polyketide cyclase / dehydrase and lipid transport